MAQRINIRSLGQYAVLPKGWRRVLSGKTREGDRAIDTVSLQFCALDCKPGLPVSWFYCVIRKKLDE